MNRKRVVITGMGCLSSIGTSVESTWQNLLAGTSGVINIEKMDPEAMENIPSKVGAAIKESDFSELDYLEKKEARRMDRFSHFAIAASQEAVDSSRLLEFSGLDKDRVGVLIATGIGGIHTYYSNAVKLMKYGPRRVSPYYIPMLINNIASGHVSIKYGFRGPNYSVTSACASGAHGIAAAFNHILTGDADVMIVGGTEAALTALGYAGFSQAQALSTAFNDVPQKASRPFDKDRDGFVMGEGAGVIVLESLEHAQKRNAPVFAEMVAFGMSADCHHITAPCPDGSGAALAMQKALDSGSVDKALIGLVNTHGTSTPLGDIAETKAIKRVFGAAAGELQLNSTKSMIGHTLGAAGGIEAIVLAKMLAEGRVHPTINLDNPDPECDLNYTANKAADTDAEYGLSNSFGFGGHNISLLLKKFSS